MEWCHQILFINALMIYWRRPYVIVTNIPAQIHCFHVPGRFDAYSTGCVCHYKRISFGIIREKLEKMCFLNSIFLGMLYHMKYRLVSHAHVFMYLMMYLEKT